MEKLRFIKFTKVMMRVVQLISFLMTWFGLLVDIIQKTKIQFCEVNDDCIMYAGYANELKILKVILKTNLWELFLSWWHSFIYFTIIVSLKVAQSHNTLAKTFQVIFNTVAAFNKQIFIFTDSFILYVLMTTRYNRKFFLHFFAFISNVHYIKPPLGDLGKSYLKT